MPFVNDIKERLSIFTNLYDILRLVDPINKKTIVIEENEIKEIKDTCYGFWKKNTLCENCIAMRAYYEKDICVKLEIKDESIVLVIATSINLNNDNYVLEMVKNISKGSNFLKTNKESIHTITEILQSMNEKIIKDERKRTFNNARLVED